MSAPEVSPPSVTAVAAITTASVFPDAIVPISGGRGSAAFAGGAALRYTAPISLARGAAVSTSSLGSA